MKIGCCAGHECMQTVQDAGYDYIELGVGTVKPESTRSEFEPILELVKSFRIKPEAWNCLLPGDLHITGPVTDIDRQQRYLRTAFERIEELGGHTVVFGSGGSTRVPDGFSTDEAWQQLVDFVTFAGQIAAKHGITFVIEPLNKNETNVINSVEEGMKLVIAVHHPSVKCLADLYHIMEEHEPLQHIIDAGGDLRHAHIADTGRFCPGTGSYPTRGFFEALKSAGYNGMMSVECRWKNFGAECKPVLEFLRKTDAEVNG
ncbi:MAG: sugar phosphate isomerase/epimerase family protein [Armatimonadota bacterium]